MKGCCKWCFISLLFFSFRCHRLNWQGTAIHLWEGTWTHFKHISNVFSLSVCVIALCSQHRHAFLTLCNSVGYQVSFLCDGDEHWSTALWLVQLRHGHRRHGVSDDDREYGAACGQQTQQADSFLPYPYPRTRHYWPCQPSLWKQCPFFFHLHPGLFLWDISFLPSLSGGKRSFPFGINKLLEQLWLSI